MWIALATWKPGSIQNTFLPGCDQLTARWTCACGDGGVSHTALQRCGSIVWPKAKPPAGTAFHQTPNTALLSTGVFVWYKQPRRDIVGYMSYLALYYALSAPPLWNIMLLTHQLFALAIFSICSRDRDQCVCSSWPKAKGSFWYNPHHRSDFVYSNMVSLPSSN